MKYLKQFSIILTFCFIGELLNQIIPLTIPAGIYGFILLFIALQTNILALSQIETTGFFLLEIMPVMFIPSAVGIMTMWLDIQNIILPLLLIVMISTLIVMISTGKVADRMMKDEGPTSHD